MMGTSAAAMYLSWKSVNLAVQLKMGAFIRENSTGCIRFAVADGWVCQSK